jgi:uncharacterized protein (DUF433 family)
MYYRDMSTALPTEHPHVNRDEQGRPVVGTAGLQLHVLAEYWRLGWSLDELSAGYPFLTMAEILGGLSFYLDHREEVEALIQANWPPQTSSARAAGSPEADGREGAGPTASPPDSDRQARVVAVAGRCARVPFFSDNLVRDKQREKEQEAESRIAADAPIVQRLSGTLSQEVTVDDYRKHLEAKYAGDA